MIFQIEELHLFTDKKWADSKISNDCPYDRAAEAMRATPCGLARRPTSVTRKYTSYTKIAAVCFSCDSLNVSEFKESMIMTSKSSLTAEIISQAQSYDGIRAGIVRLKDVLKGYSYQAATDDAESQGQLDDDQIVDWPKEARTVLILGLNHPEKNPRLDWLERGDTWGNRRIREISELLKK